MSPLAARSVALLILPALAACGGGGGGSSALPSTSFAAPAPIASHAPVVAAAPQTATVVVTVGGAEASAARRAAYISPATKSMGISVTPAGGTAATTIVNCAAACSATLTAPIGTVTLAASLYDGTMGSGNLLSTGSSTVQIAGGQTNTVPISFGGQIASISISYDTTKLVAATAATVPLAVAVRDAAGNVIVGNEPFTTPVTVAVSDATGVLKIQSGTTQAASALMTSNATATSLVYSGGTVAASTVTATAGTIAATASVPALSATGSVGVVIAIPAVPAHVATYYYYGGGGLNTAIPASFMAKAADWVEGDETTALLMNAYKAAGGAHAIVYSDPTYQPYCSSPFTMPSPGACTGPIASLITAETAWYHDALGNRIHRAQPGSTIYSQEALNLGSAAAQAGYAAFTAKMVANSPALDGFFADDSGGVYAVSGDPMAGLFYNFSAAAVEVTSDAQFQTQEKAMLASATRPVIINGHDPSTWAPSYSGAILTAPNVIGQNQEGCYTNAGTLMTDTASQFQRESNGLLAIIANQRQAFCMMMGPMTPANRLYQMAAFWLTYDPVYSVAAPVAATSDGYATFAEYDIVPRSPLTTATTDVAVLRSSATGAYVREFGSCYQAKTGIGACAAVVNSSGVSVPMPALSRSYSAALVLDDKSSYTGGTATWGGSVPTSIPAGGGVILRQ